MHTYIHTSSVSQSVKSIVDTKKKNKHTTFIIPFRSCHHLFTSGGKIFFIPVLSSMPILSCTVNKQPYDLSKYIVISPHSLPCFVAHSHHINALLSRTSTFTSTPLYTCTCISLFPCTTNPTSSSYTVPSSSSPERHQTNSNLIRTHPPTPNSLASSPHSFTPATLYLFPQWPQHNSMLN